VNKVLQALQRICLHGVTEYDVTVDGERLRQLTGELPSGEQIHVMASSEGWHVAFGAMSPYGAPPAVSEHEAAQIILSA